VQKQLQSNGKYTVEIVAQDGSDKKIDLTSEYIKVEEVEETRHVEEITPSVVEPSFGIGRIMYVVLEHCFREREGDENRTYLELPPLIAPVKCSILPISSKPELNQFIQDVRSQLTSYDLSNKVDDTSGSIGKRYSRSDEIGIPFGVTIDFETASQKQHTVTLRYAPTMQQIRLKVCVFDKRFLRLLFRSIKLDTLFMSSCPAELLGKKLLRSSQYSRPNKINC
jgi:glycyl-tRNA synthetase